MISKSQPSLCFDLDGTLVDTAPDLVRVLNMILAFEGLPPSDYGPARASVGRGARALIIEACARGAHKLDPAWTDELVALFLKLYADDIAQMSKPFPGVVETLRALKQYGAHLSVCTNKPGYLARPLISRLGLSGFFERIVGSEDVPAKKPAAGHIFTAANHRQAQNIVMIGDSAPDVAAARAARVPVIVLSYGYADRPLAALRADKILHRFTDLPAALKALGYL